MEIELKLGPLEPALARRVFGDETLLPLSAPEERIEMRTTYYENAAGFFAENRQTLRLRRENERCLCTFKSRAKGLARLELEHPAATLDEGVQALLADPALPEDTRRALEQGGLYARCGAAFVRRTRVVEAFGCAFHLCLDEGVLTCGSRTQPLCELELELIRGEEQALQQAYAALNARCALPVCRKSKQQRALELEEKHE